VQIDELFNRFTRQNHGVVMSYVFNFKEVKDGIEK